METAQTLPAPDEAGSFSTSTSRLQILAFLLAEIDRGDLPARLPYLMMNKVCKPFHTNERVT